MLKKLFILLFFVLCEFCLALDVKIKSNQHLGKNIIYSIYSASEFPMIAHVLKLSLDNIDIKLIPALGQREEVSSIAKRSNAFIAINGSNYRRGGKYNGNRLNLLYLKESIYSDFQFIRGSFGWCSRIKRAIIDNTFLKINFLINKQAFPVDQINQPRDLGQSVLYTDKADKFLLLHIPGKNIIIDEKGIVQDITSEIPREILPGYLIYQIDRDSSFTIKKGMNTEFNYEIKSVENNLIYNDYDFVIGGAGLLLRNGEIMTSQLYNEFSQGTAIVHCHDEVAADFYTKKQQQWLIEQRHPRTAIGITDKDEICIVVVDGRQNNSEGLTLHELASFMKMLCCTNALNIGGGGCTTLCINKEVVNNPSANEERPVSEALCFYLR